MQITTADNLTVEQLARLARLEKRAIKADSGQFKLEWGVLQAGRLCGAVLAEDGGELAGYFGRYRFGSERTEIAGVVDPHARGNGLGTSLLTETLRMGREAGEKDALLVVRRDIPGGAALAKRFGGVLHHSEHALVMRKRPVDAPDDKANTIRVMRDAEWPTVRSLLQAAFGVVQDQPSTEPGDRTLVVERDGRIIGTLRTSVYGGDRAAVYGFAIEETLRGHGIGRDVLRRTCRGLFDGGAASVALEVAVDNDRALRLYTSLGFEPVTTEDYYLLST